ncbi:MAG: hypothetical protein WCH99_14040 [Verrucomicrobiota bacterium]
MAASKPNILEIIENLLGQLEDVPLVQMPDAKIKPDRMAKLKASCSLLFPFKSESSASGKRHAHVTRSKAKTIKKSKTVTAETKRFRAMLDKLMVKRTQRDLRAALIELGLATESKSRLKLTGPGQKLIKSQTNDPRVSRLQKLLK